MHQGRGGQAFAGTVGELLRHDDDELVARLRRHHVTVAREHNPSGQQLESWKKTVAILRRAFGTAAGVMHGVHDWGIALEYELPFEGGRRPDVVVLGGSTVVVIEFKDSPRHSAAHADQARAYARDIREYHERSRGLDVHPVLLYGIEVRATQDPGLPVVGPEGLADVLTGLAAGPQADITEWVESEYAPLPMIVEAARRIFEHKPLPRLRRAESLGLNATVDAVQALIERTRSEQTRRLVLIAGVPGAGKTLAGLRLVYESHHEGAPPALLSGNGPLVEVLQDALGSRVFVKDLHKFILEYGAKKRTPPQHVVVFDEAQRAWDHEMMLTKKDIAASEPDLLVEASDRVDGWSVLVGLVGDGQEIHSGEEGGLRQWDDAIASSPSDWEVHGPARLQQAFTHATYEATSELDLNRSMRSHRAEELHLWVAHVLSEQIELAAELATRLLAADFTIRITRELDEAKTYARARYEGEPLALYGLLASSHAKDLVKCGVYNDFQTTKRVRIAKWFNAPPDDPASACALEQPATEFMCQGLELDLPVVCWGNDMVWERDEWRTTAIRRRIPLRDPDQIVRNTYRVLLTRGRDGLVIFVPPTARHDATAAILEAAGATSLADVVTQRLRLGAHQDGATRRAAP